MNCWQYLIVTIVAGELYRLGGRALYVCVPHAAHRAQGNQGKDDNSKGIAAGTAVDRNQHPLEFPVLLPRCSGDRKQEPKRVRASTHKVHEIAAAYSNCCSALHVSIRSAGH